MEAYIDLSFIVFFINYVISFVYSLILFDRLKYKLFFIVQSMILALIMGIINLLFVPYFFIMGTVLYSLIIGIFNLRYLKVILSSLMIYYLNCGLLLLIGGCFLYEGFLLISTPFVSFFILIEPIYITLIHLVGNILFKYIKYKNFRIKCFITLDNHHYKGKGYYDSGNCLTYHDLPVIFIKGKPLSNNGEVIKIKGINDYSFSYLAFKGTLSIKKSVKNVYIVFVNKNMNFYNCEFLLNKYVM